MVEEAESNSVEGRRHRDDGDSLPFVLRAWWLRDSAQYSDRNWVVDPSMTAPVWSTYSDPLCDAGGTDYAT